MSCCIERGMRPSTLVNDKRFYILDEPSRFVEGQGRHFEVNGCDIAVFRTKDGLRAFGNKCPHEGRSLCDGAIQQGNIVCPGHGWRFDPTTGTRVEDASVKIPTYELVEKDGYVWVNVENL